MRGFTLRFLFVACVVASNCLAQPFFFRKDIPLGGPPASVVSGDFNGDHRMDLAVYIWNWEAGNSGVFTLMNKGGDFGPPVSAGVDSNLFQLGLPLVADFNGDGRDDLVMADGNVYLSRGDGTFQLTYQLNNGRDFIIRVLAAADFNGDGKSDLVISSPTGGTRVLLGNGDGTFRSGPMVTGASVFCAVIADFNRDGRKDIAFEDLFSDSFMPGGLGVIVYLGNGDGTFADPVRTKLNPMDATSRVAFPPGGFLVADFNGDGSPDLATLNGIMLGKGDGSFQSPLPYPVWREPDARFTAYAAMDLNGDRKADLVISNGINSVYICLAKGDGALSPPTGEIAVGWGVQPPAVNADLDGDGRVDLVFTGSSNTLSLLMNKPQGGPQLQRAVSAASGIAITAPQSMATLYARTPVISDISAPPPGMFGNWPTNLGGVSLQVKDSAGATRLAPLLFVSPTQINFEVPAGTAIGEANLAIMSAAGSTQAGSMQVNPVAPGLFWVSPIIPAATAMLVKTNGEVVSLPVFRCSPSEPGTCSLSPIPLSTADGTIYISFYGTGFHGANSDNVVCLINGEPMPVLYAGPQGIPGLDQVNIRLLPDVFPNMGYQVVIYIDGVAANSAALAIE